MKVLNREIIFVLIVLSALSNFCNAKTDFTYVAFVPSNFYVGSYEKPEPVIGFYYLLFDMKSLTVEFNHDKDGIGQGVYMDHESCDSREWMCLFGMGINFSIHKNEKLSVGKKWETLGYSFTVTGTEKIQLLNKKIDVFVIQNKKHNEGQDDYSSFLYSTRYGLIAFDSTIAKGERGKEEHQDLIYWIQGDKGIFAQ